MVSARSLLAAAFLLPAEVMAKRKGVPAIDGL